MSVRTEPRELSERLHGALNLSADQLQQQGVKLQEPAGTAGAYQGEPMMMQAPTSTSAGAVALPGNEHALAEANSFNTSHPEYPLNRTVSVTIRASLNDLCLRKTASVWAPNSDAVKSILQQARAPFVTAHNAPRLTNSHCAPRSASTPTSPAALRTRATSRALSCTS